MKEGDTLQLSYKLIDCEIPDNGYVKCTARHPLWWMWTKMAWSRPLTPLRVL